MSSSGVPDVLVDIELNGGLQDQILALLASLDEGADSLADSPLLE